MTKWTTIALGFFSAFFLALASFAHGETRKPNIVFIFIDDMGYADPSCFGNPHVKTKNIDRLAAEGIKLTNFYVNSPICSASRVAITTGQYQGRWKIHSYLNTRAGNKSRGMRDYLDGAAPTTAKKLKAAGYATAHFGKWHMGGGRDVDDAPLPSEYGFDESYVAFEGLGDRLLTNPKNNSIKLKRGQIDFCDRWQKTEKYTDRAIDFIRRNKDKPFYVRLMPNDVHDAHVPWPGTQEKWAKVTNNKWEQKFFAVLEEMDKQIGRVIDEVEQLGLSEDTLFIFTSDNGPTDWPKYYRDNEGGPPGFTGPFFGRKWSLYEGGIRMPFIARWKGKIPAGATDESSIMAAIDLSPTLCKLAEVPIPANEKLDGVDCSEVLYGKPSDRKPIFWQYGPPHAVLRPGKAEFQSPSFAMRDGDWKMLANPDGSEAQLFNLKKDEGESTNLLATESDRARTMLASLSNWAHEIGFDFDATAKPKPPAANTTASINGQLRTFRNHGVEVTDAGWNFDGKSWLDMPKFAAPRIAGGKRIRITASILPRGEGVIFAHGGDKSGYSLYLQGGELCFATCVDWKRKKIGAEWQKSPESKMVEAIWEPDGRMQLKIDKKRVADGASAVLQQQPGDSAQIGADTIKPVGDYSVNFAFDGVISNFQIRHDR